jgi:phenylacetate-CoA ligase
VFGKVLDHYGQAERVAALQLCNEGHYHVREDYSFVEFVSDSHGKRIVGTNIHNAAMPLTRYDTNDYVQGVNASTKCACGNPSSFVESILGRDDDYIVLPTGKIVGRLDVVFKGVESIVECQLEQTHIDTLVVRYVPRNDWSKEAIEEDLTQRLRERLGESIILNFSSLSHVPRTKAGKFRSVIRNKDIVCA